MAVQRGLLAPTSVLTPGFQPRTAARRRQVSPLVEQEQQDNTLQSIKDAQKTAENLREIFASGEFVPPDVQGANFSPVEGNFSPAQPSDPFASLGETRGADLFTAPEATTVSEGLASEAASGQLAAEAAVQEAVAPVVQEAAVDVAAQQATKAVAQAAAVESGIVATSEVAVGEGVAAALAAETAAEAAVVEGGAAIGGETAASAQTGAWPLILAAIIYENETNARGSGYRNENDSKFVRDMLTGKVVEQDVDRWAEVFGFEDTAVEKSLQFGADLATLDFGNAFETLEDLF